MQQHISSIQLGSPGKGARAGSSGASYISAGAAASPSRSPPADVPGLCLHLRACCCEELGLSAATPPGGFVPEATNTTSGCLAVFCPLSQTPCGQVPTVLEKKNSPGLSFYRN